MLNIMWFVALWWARVRPGVDLCDSHNHAVDRRFGETMNRNDILPELNGFR